MPRLAYYDTSVLLKQYVAEIGTADARSCFKRHGVLSSAIATVEVVSAFRQRAARGDIGEGDLAACLDAFRRDRDRWELIPVESEVLRRAEEVVGGAAVRAIDAIHIGSALVFMGRAVGAVPFITADSRQRDAAKGMGLEVVWIGSR